MTAIDERRMGPGRPPASDPSAIALAAVRLFLERGYDNVTMADVAEAAGIGRSTLFRYFRSKGSLLWYEDDLHKAEFRRAMAATTPEVPLVGAVFDAYARFMERHAHELALAKTINAVIATSPPSSTGKWEAFAAWSEDIAGFAAERRGGDRKDVANATIGMVLWAALYSAMERWALSEDADPGSHLARAQEALEWLGREA